MSFDWEARTKVLTKLSKQERLTRSEAQEMARQIQTDHIYIIKKTGTITGRPSDKLDYPMTHQHYEIIHESTDRPNTFKLRLSDQWRGSKWFYADRLCKYANNPVPGQATDEPNGVIIDPNLREEEWELTNVLTSRFHYNKLQYQILWKGWDPDGLWCPAGDFKNSAELLKAYHDEYPDAAGPPARLEHWLQAAQSDEFDPPHPDNDKPAKITRSRMCHRG
ncbi:Uu.00g137940.m01.CDS01 [Anthostomella pinea]|uniref:Uu.00g137940.m01.CDS01 n=1 Tax=Anthostomella pinea TaxID=933095 RepID=A0AAI8VPL2_9PEZI|nr:Uu.00g137940.m01.CDS01 [Anthostomella pinea]